MTNMVQGRGPLSPSRRDVLLRGAGLLGAATLGTATLGGLPRMAFAEDQAPVGTWPAGVAGSTAFIGVDAPMTGTYAVPGQDEIKGYELAIEHVNEGNEIIRTMAPKVSQGLLGKKLIYGVANSEAKPNVAVQNSRSSSPTTRRSWSPARCLERGGRGINNSPSARR